MSPLSDYSLVEQIEPSVTKKKLENLLPSASFSVHCDSNNINDKPNECSASKLVHFKQPAERMERIKLVEKLLKRGRKEGRQAGKVTALNCN